MSAYDDSSFWRAGLADADDVEAEALREDEMQPDTVFVVDGYTDRIAERRRKKAEADIEYQKKCGHVRLPRIFPTRAEAVNFICERIAGEVREAEKSLKNIKRRLRKWEHQRRLPNATR